VLGEILFTQNINAGSLSEIGIFLFQPLPGGGPINSLTYMEGLCVPSTCSADDLNTIFSALTLAGKVSISFEVNDKYCWTREPRTLSDGSWGFM